MPDKYKHMLGGPSLKVDPHTGAVAEGRTRFVATGAIETWEVTVDNQGNERFQPGSATSVAIATAEDRRDVTDAHQWLVNVTLVER